MKAPRKQWLGYRYIFRRAIVYSQGTAEERRWRTKEMEGRRRKTQHICVCCIYIYIYICGRHLALCKDFLMFVRFFFLSSSFSNILFFFCPGRLYYIEWKKKKKDEQRRERRQWRGGLACVLCVCASLVIISTLAPIRIDLSRDPPSTILYHRLASPVHDDDDDCYDYYIFTKLCALRIISLVQ